MSRRPRVCYAAPPERVWTALLSIRQLPFDRSDLANIESPVEKNRVPASLEVLGSPIRIEAPTQRPPVQLVVKTVEPGLAYSGTWTIVLTPEDDETRVTIVEDATIRSRALRFFVRTDSRRRRSPRGNLPRGQAQALRRRPAR